MPLTAPTQALAVGVTCARGQTVEIPLRAGAAGREAVHFLIREGPKVGTLGEIKMLTVNHGTVLYTHSGEAALHRDTFTYAVQTAAGVSAAAEVRILIQENVSSLVVPEALDFGEVRFGATPQLDIPITNQAGAVAQGTAQITGPWRIVGAPTFALKAGETHRLGIQFTGGKSVGDAPRGEITYDGFPGRHTLLTARLKPPFLVAGDRVFLERMSTSGQSTGNLLVANPGDTTLGITVVADDDNAIIAQGMLKVPARDKATLKIAGLAGLAKETSLTLSAGGYTKVVTVAPPAPVIAVGLGLNDPPPAAATPAPAPSFSPALKVATAPVSTAITATAPPPFAPAPPTPPVVSNPNSPNNPEPPETSAEEAGPPTYPLLEVQIGEVTRRSAQLSWQDEGGWDYLVEYRQLALGADGALQTTWVPWTDLVIQHQPGQRVHADLRHLDSGTLYAFRITLHHGAGEPERRSMNLLVSTPARPPFFTPLRGLIAVFLVLLGVILWQKFHRR